jgi:hypothetical protein
MKKHTESSAERVASTIADFFSCSCTMRLSMLSSMTKLDSLHGSTLAEPMDPIHSLYMRGEVSKRHETSTCAHEIQPAKPDSRQGSIQSAAGGKGRTAGFHQLSMRYTRDASVRLSATPPAFKLTRKTVTCTLFTKENQLIWRSFCARDLLKC